MANEFSHWRGFRALVASGVVENEGDFNRSLARYRVARSFEYVSFGSLSQSTSEAYSAAIHVGLCYSTLESLSLALDVEPRTLPVQDESLALVFRGRRFESLHLHLLKGEDGRNKKQLSDVRDFIAGKSDNLQPVAARLRNLMFHGLFTAHGSGSANSRAMTAALTRLGERILDATDEHFTNWVMQKSR